MKRAVWSNFFNTNTVFRFLFEFGAKYPTPDTLSYSWNFGFIALCCLALQIITGLILVFHYTPDAALAFDSIENFMRETSYGYFVRYSHANGASFFFMIVYIHMGKAFFQGSYVHPREAVWITGVTIFILMIVTAFLGYVLPWGQMSFWGATVITNLVTVVPFVGNSLVEWIWGGFSIANPTLVRFFGLHFALPFIILALALFHLIFLHNSGSSNKLGAGGKLDNRSFMPLFFLKDFGFLNWVIAFLGFFNFFRPNYLGHPDNYIKANPLITPVHIVPEWYFLPFYAILRSVPSKVFGVILLALSLIVLFILPYINKANPKVSTFNAINEMWCVGFLLNCLFLGWIGGQPVEPLYIWMARVLTFLYFFYFFIVFKFFNEFYFGAAVHETFFEFQQAWQDIPEASSSVKYAEVSSDRPVDSWIDVSKYSEKAAQSRDIMEVVNAPYTEFREVTVTSKVKKMYEGLENSGSGQDKTAVSTQEEFEYVDEPSKKMTGNIQGCLWSREFRYHSDDLYLTPALRSVKSYGGWICSLDNKIGVCFCQDYVKVVLRRDFAKFFPFLQRINRTFRRWIFKAVILKRCIVAVNEVFIGNLLRWKRQRVDFNLHSVRVGTAIAKKIPDSQRYKRKRWLPIKRS